MCFPLAGGQFLKRKFFPCVSLACASIVTTRILEDTVERRSASRRVGNEIAPPNLRYQQTSAAGLRPADDLLPHSDARQRRHHRHHGGDGWQLRGRLPALAR